MDGGVCVLSQPFQLPFSKSIRVLLMIKEKLSEECKLVKAHGRIWQYVKYLKL